MSGVEIVAEPVLRGRAVQRSCRGRGWSGSMSRQRRTVARGVIRLCNFVVGVDTHAVTHLSDRGRLGRCAAAARLLDSPFVYYHDEAWIHREPEGGLCSSLKCSMEDKTVEMCFRPPNSVALVMDPRTGVVPATLVGNAVAATDSCVAVGTLEESNGMTMVRLERLGAAGHENPDRVWRGELVVSEQLAVMTVLGETVLSCRQRDLFRWQSGPMMLQSLTCTD